MGIGLQIKYPGRPDRLLSLSVFQDSWLYPSTPGLSATRTRLIHADQASPSLYLHLAYLWEVRFPQKKLFGQNYDYHRGLRRSAPTKSDTSDTGIKVVK